MQVDETSVGDDSGLLKMALASLRNSVHKLQLTSSISSISSEVIGTGLREISLKEVSMHDDASSCWIIIYDRVYDVTTFLNTHPGGYDVILEYAGRDASMAFRGTGHSNFAVLSLKKYEIGELPMNERIFRCLGKLMIRDLPL